MSKRRHVEEVVQLNDNEGGPYLGRIDALGAERRDECPQCSFDPAHDQQCREWPNVEILDGNQQPTGKYVYHVAECEMTDTV